MAYWAFPRYHALRCAALYFIICDLCIVDPMYQPLDFPWHCFEALILQQLMDLWHALGSPWIGSSPCSTSPLGQRFGKVRTAGRQDG